MADAENAASLGLAARHIRWPSSHSEGERGSVLNRSHFNRLAPPPLNTTTDSKRALASLSPTEINHHADMDLDSMKYAELRSLAKELGLKANMKVTE